MVPRILAFIMLIAVSTEQAHAWNPFKAVASVVSKAVGAVTGAVGDVAGKAVGGVADNIIGPLLDKLSPLFEKVLSGVPAIVEKFPFTKIQEKLLDTVLKKYDLSVQEILTSAIDIGKIVVNEGKKLAAIAKDLAKMRKSLKDIKTKEQRSDILTKLQNTSQDFEKLKDTLDQAKAMVTIGKIISACECAPEILAASCAPAAGQSVIFACNKAHMIQNKKEELVQKCEDMIHDIQGRLEQMEQVNSMDSNSIAEAVANKAAEIAAKKAAEVAAEHMNQIISEQKIRVASSDDSNNDSDAEPPRKRAKVSSSDEETEET